MLSKWRDFRFIVKKISEVTNVRQLVSIETPGCQRISINHPIKKFHTTSITQTLTNPSSPIDETTEQTIKYESITNGDEALETKLKIIMLEAEVLRQEGKAVPEDRFITTAQWTELLHMSTRTARKRYLEYLFKLSKKLENIEAKKEKKRAEYEEMKRQKLEEDKGEETVEDHAMTYDLQHNNLFLRVYDSTINRMYNSRLIKAIQFGQKLVVDCGYYEDMTKRENLSCAKQLMLLFAENRLHADPFDLHLCNINRESYLFKQLHKFIPTMDEPDFPLHLHESSYLDVFPKDQLVYLTPHCREELTEFDHDSVYIIGGIVDKVNNEPLSMAKAKREGIKMAKLPLDRYLQWGAGSGKSLTLNQVTGILLEAKQSGEWEKALVSHVPKRKLVEVGSRNYSEAFRHGGAERKWKPSVNVDFGKLSYNNDNSDRSGGKRSAGGSRSSLSFNVRSLYEE